MKNTYFENELAKIEITSENVTIKLTDSDANQTRYLSLCTCEDIDALINFLEHRAKFLNSMGD